MRTGLPWNIHTRESGVVVAARNRPGIGALYIPSYNWSYSIIRSSILRDGQSYCCTFFLGKSVPGLKLTNPPAAGETITASYAIEYPFKTENNLLRFTCSIQLQRG